MEHKIKQNQIAGAIIIAGLLIAGAILLKGNTPNIAGEQNLKDKKIKIAKDEHLLGNPNAEIVVVEYSDMECPFSKRFHATRQQIMETKSNEIAWVYRHFPLTSIHPTALTEAMASECAFEQGNNEIFWQYLNEVYSRTESNNGLNALELPKIAENLGLDVTAFNTCLETKKYEAKVNDSLAGGMELGVSGTPKSFILKNGKVVDTIEGAYPYEEVIKKIDKALQ